MAIFTKIDTYTLLFSKQYSFGVEKNTKHVVLKGKYSYPQRLEKPAQEMLYKDYWE